MPFFEVIVSFLCIVFVFFVHNFWFSPSFLTIFEKVVFFTPFFLTFPFFLTIFLFLEKKCISFDENFDENFDEKVYLFYHFFEKFQNFPPKFTYRGSISCLTRIYFIALFTAGSDAEHGGFLSHFKENLITFSPLAELFLKVLLLFLNLSRIIT